ncbi:MAG: hypothetical protein M0P16_12600, partial [Syntrophales bacterium]|nr:hypothetical protein [Syntrophales bacterium]
LGFTVLISPISAGISALVWVVVYGIARIPFIASFFMIAVLALGTIIACGLRTEAVAGTVATVLFIFNNHRQNVAAFFHGGVRLVKTSPQPGSSSENKSAE